MSVLRGAGLALRPSETRSTHASSTVAVLSGDAGVVSAVERSFASGARNFDEWAREQGVTCPPVAAAGMVHSG